MLHDQVHLVAVRGGVLNSHPCMLSRMTEEQLTHVYFMQNQHHDCMHLKTPWSRPLKRKVNATVCIAGPLTCLHSLGRRPRIPDWPLRPVPAQHLQQGLVITCRHAQWMTRCR